MKLKNFLAVMAIGLCVSTSAYSSCDLELLQTKTIPIAGRDVRQKFIKASDSVISLNFLDIKWQAFVNDPSTKDLSDTGLELVDDSGSIRLYRKGKDRIIFMHNVYDGNVLNVVGDEKSISDFVKELNKCGRKASWVLQ